jgi:ethanolamine utilization protein EutP (predicted NTPase)
MMNERIQELSSQARDYASEYVADCKRYGYYMEHNEYDLRFEAKFAELIVRECQFAIVSRTDLPKHERKLYNNVLKEHFGVEE